MGWTEWPLAYVSISGAIAFLAYAGATLACLAYLTRVRRDGLIRAGFMLAVLVTLIYWLGIATEAIALMAPRWGK